MVKINGNMRAAGYFRVSSEEQVENWSLDAQERAFQEFCRSKGWEPVLVYREEGRSAWTEKLSKRPKFRQVLEDSKSHKFDVVVVHSLDRWARNLLVTLDSFRILSQHSVTFVSIQEQIDYTTPEGRLFLIMLGAFAQYFSDALARHTTKGLRERALRGLYNGEPPFGYARCTVECWGQPGHSGCHALEEESKAVQEMFSRYAGGGWSLSRLAAWLNEQGLKTKNTKVIRLADGEVLEGPQPFTAYSVRWILHNAFYTGKVVYRGEAFPGAHHPLVHERQFRDVVDRLARSRSRTHTATTAKRAYLLQGLARCVHCGYPMWADSRGRNHTAYYRERPGLSGSKCNYGAWSVPAKIADTQMEHIFSRLTLLEDWKTRVIARLSSVSERQRILKERDALEARLKRLTEMYIEGNIARESYQERQRATKQMLDTLVIPELDASIIAGSLVEDLPRLWAEANVNQRNHMLASMLDAVLLDPSSRSVVGLVPRPAFREIFLSVEMNDGVKIYDPNDEPKKETEGPSGSEGLPRSTMLGYGGDGGESNSPSRSSDRRICYKLIRRSWFRLSEHPPTESPKG